MHDGNAGVVCCLPGFCSGELFFKCVGSFPIFFEVVKEEFSQVLIVDTGA